MKSCWDRARIEHVFRTCFGIWKSMGNGMPWCQKFINEHGGRNMLRAVAHADLTPEGYLRSLDGEIFARWVKLQNPWSVDRARDLFREAHQRWRTDARCGKPAGRTFNVYYLERIGLLSLVASVRRHHARGIDDFARRIPEISGDWTYRARRTNREIGTQVYSLYRQWLRDPTGRAAGLPFGPLYLRRNGHRGLIDLMARRGISRILPGRRGQAVRRAWGTRIRAG